MAMPNLQRITIASEQELAIWLSRHRNHEDSVMLVTFTNPSHRKYVSRDRVNELLAEHQWTADRCYTLCSDLLGHVITKSAS